MRSSGNRSYASRIRLSLSSRSPRRGAPSPSRTCGCERRLPRTAAGYLRCNTGLMPEPARAEDRRILERLALAEWSEDADARIVSVTVAGDRAEVALVVNGDHDHWTYFQRDDQ